MAIPSCSNSSAVSDCGLMRFPALGWLSIGYLSALIACTNQNHSSVYNKKQRGEGKERGTMISMASGKGPRVDWLTPLTVPIGDASVFIVFVEFAGNRPADFRPTVDSTIRSRGSLDKKTVVLVLRISTGSKTVFPAYAGICRENGFRTSEI
jgi:hypothetical protein